MPAISDILDASWAYRLWQSPFAAQKIAPIFKHSEISDSTRVLDVGCGPGTNSRFFHDCPQYVGVDLNPRYIESASRRYKGKFVAADVRTYLPPDKLGYDFILANSFFHHIDDSNTEQILKRLHELLTPAGEIHVLDLVMPSRPSIARWLARHDRGEHPRPIEQWRGLFGGVFAEITFEPYPVSLLGIPMWRMVYFRGRRKPSSENATAEKPEPHAKPES